MNKLSLSSIMITEELGKRGIPFKIEYAETLNTLISVEINDKKLYIKGTLHPQTTANGYIFAEDKILFYDIVGQKWTTPETLRLSVGDNQVEAIDFVMNNKPVVVKPADGAHGNGVSMNICTKEDLNSAVAVAQSFSDRLVVQKQIEGKDYRLLVIGGKFSCASRREPASVTGDGVNSVRTLIELENKQPNRGLNYSKQLERINIDKVEEVLSEKELLEVPALGAVCTVLKTPNIGQGGKAYDVTDIISKEYIRISEEVASKFEVYCCGVDIITPDISKYDGAESYAIVEINASPSFGLHALPFEGTKKNPAAMFVESLISYSERKT